MVEALLPMPLQLKPQVAGHPARDLDDPDLQVDLRSPRDAHIVGQGFLVIEVLQGGRLHRRGFAGGGDLAGDP